MGLRARYDSFDASYHKAVQRAPIEVRNLMMQTGTELELQ
ncbi:hypothetical protein SAMN05518671_2577 [Stenotrophomonas lactitubi]|nr:hypothetical protein SAMN04487863_1335 [Stenotrophomonas sp. yr243]SNT50853.1 hypothetical protein SAMN05518671_2577 [Stenotrophomonas lactitubi]